METCIGESANLGSACRPLLSMAQKTSHNNGNVAYVWHRDTVASCLSALGGVNISPVLLRPPFSLTGLGEAACRSPRKIKTKCKA